MHQSVIEVGTGICKNIAEARQDVGELRTEIIRLARKNGLRVAAAARTPSPTGATRTSIPDARYDSVVEDMQLVARANLIFGLHVHVGIEDRELAIQIMNEARYFLPHMLALSTNSPFWLGRNTGLKSLPDARSSTGSRAPASRTTSTRCAEFDEFVRMLVKTNCIDNAKKIWWDVRPHPFFATLEFRICDMPDARRRDARHRRADPGDLRQAVQAAPAEPGLPPLPPRADHREQVARRAATASRAS